MAITIHSQSTYESDLENESWLHLTARECRGVLRWIVGGSAVVTVIAMFTVFYWAILPALVLLISYCVLIAANQLERRSHGPHQGGLEQALVAAEQAAVAAEADPEQREKKVIDKAVDGKITKTVIAIVIGAAVLSVILGVVVAWHYTGWPTLALGAMILFAYIILVGAPVWLGWIQDEAEEEQHRVEHKLHGD
jgi:fatty acid desaturase